MVNGYNFPSPLRMAFVLGSDRLIGGGILAGSIAGVVVYGLLLIYAAQITLMLTAFLGIASILVILSWIGYTMVTTPPPEPIEDMPKVEEGAKADTGEPKT